MKKQIHGMLTEIYAHAVGCLDSLIAEVTDRTPAAASFDAMRAAMEALPLNTAEAAILRNRLNNVRHYADAGEYGAACYELRLLAHSQALSEGDSATNPEDELGELGGAPTLQLCRSHRSPAGRDGVHHHLLPSEE